MSKLASTAPIKPTELGTVEELASFGEITGRPVRQFRLCSSSGIEVDIIEYGAIIRTFKVPCKGTLRDIVLGFDSLSEYLQQSSFIGSIVGPYANRIANAQYELNGETIQLEANEGENILHSGSAGLHLKHWQGKIDQDQLVLTVSCAHNEAGFPGSVDIEARYYFSDSSTLALDITAKPSEARPISITQHSYFNLNGENSNETNQVLTVHSSHHLPVDESGIPIGEKLKNDQARMNLSLCDTKEASVDHHYCSKGGSLTALASLKSSSRDLTLTVTSDAPGLQVYTGQYLPACSGKSNSSYQTRSGVCLEPQQWPDSPNNPAAPVSTIAQGQVYTHRLRFEIS